MVARSLRRRPTCRRPSPCCARPSCSVPRSKALWLPRCCRRSGSSRRSWTTSSRPGAWCWPRTSKARRRSPGGSSCTTARPRRATTWSARHRSVAATSLRQLLWNRASGVILMSATLTSCGTFDLFLQQSGLSVYASRAVPARGVAVRLSVERQARHSCDAHGSWRCAAAHATRSSSACPVSFRRSVRWCCSRRASRCARSMRCCRRTCGVAP